ncbi:acyl-CoA synthetase [Frigidibacter sp. MR17.24]|uniref:acyl-CoA synthetase n=1 Tax=Frigidibacter sp. MR17.24 TaxID=3127345 RepID=UPI003012C611
MSIYDEGLGRRPANHRALTPISWLERAAQVHPDRVAVIHGRARQSYRALWSDCRRLASALTRRGIGRGDTVSVLLPNTPPMVAAHYGVPMADGAVLHALNTRLDAAAIAFQLDHARSRVLIVDREFSAVAAAALALARTRPLVIDVDDDQYPADAPRPKGACIGDLDWPALLAEGDPGFDWTPPGDEWDAIALNYTSGTTGNPKGVVYSHRGAALSAINNTLHAGMGRHPVYLWTLPMFHCNGWSLPWAVSIQAGTHVCLRWVRAGAIFDAIADHGVTHLSGAPIVMSTLLNAPQDQRRSVAGPVTFTTAAAPPPEAVLEAMAAAGFEVLHVYGLTETYGPTTVNEWKADWDGLPARDRAALKARQGVRFLSLEAVSVRDPDTMRPVPADGRTLGEVMLRGNTLMKGYLLNPEATEAAFAGDWFHTGDLGVMHADGYVQIKDRSKDIIISGGENISSIEVEEVLFRHPAVALCAVVAMPDRTWGERPCAFVELRPGHAATGAELLAHCRGALAGFKAPARVIVAELPKTSTGKIQKFLLRDAAADLARETA